MGWQGFPLWIPNQEMSQEIVMIYENGILHLQFTLQYTLQSSSNFFCAEYTDVICTCCFWPKLGQIHLVHFEDANIPKF